MELTKKALLLDDDEHCRALMYSVLKDYGYEVTALPSPSLLVPQECGPCPKDYDLIFTDNRMPGMTGLQFLDYVCNRGYTIPPENMAIASGSWSECELQEAKQLGCKVFQKPYSLKQIGDWILGCDCASTLN